MRYRLMVFAVVLAATSHPTIVAAQTADDGPVAKPSKVAPTAIAGQVARYRLADMCSVTGGTNTCLTVVEINNLSGGPCNVGVEFYKGFSTTPSCTAVVNSLGNGLQTTVCSRTTTDSAIASCNSTCTPELTFDSGYAVVYSACSRIGVQGTIYTLSGSAPTSARSVNLVRLRVPPELKANQGD